ncbi:MAG: universal stress protein [Cyanobacteria bacterium]|nr:universal stress protein [Cyanobacteriota bacterium]MDW8202274.1 universal stress protein [Cyanobacteriota bacterium SKYGB_h_bin112]
MIQKILIAVAGLGRCEEMFNMLAEIPAIQRAAVTILHVVPPQVTAEDMAAKLEEGGKILAGAVKALKIPPNQITTRLRQGDPKDVVCQIADEENADLIIMGSRGLKRLEAILSNSVSQYVFQLTSRPMLLVKDDIYIKLVKRVLVALDGSDAAKYCLKLALFFVRDIKGGQLLLTHINPVDESLPPEKDPVLAPAVAEAKAMGIPTKCFLGKGNVGAEICKLAEETNADMIILGSPDRRPSIAKALVDLDRLLGSSQSDYVRVNAPCPVLLARMPAT